MKRASLHMGYSCHKVAISKLVNSLKGVSSRRLRQAHPASARRYRNGVLWSPSYVAASCGGAPLDIVKDYVETQRQKLAPYIPAMYDGVLRRDG